MANKKKGQLTTSSEWAKHLRKYLKKRFWRGERKAGKQLVRNELFETDNLLWQFEELIKTLIAMSLPLPGQMNFYGVGATADEMLEDFYTYYTLNKSRYWERELIDEKSKKKLDEIDALTDKWTAEKPEEFWFEMENHQADWDLLRQLARQTLLKMNKDDLTVEINHENEMDENGNVIVQRTKIELKKK